VNFYEHQRRNRRYTALLIGSFVLLFAAVGAALDVSVTGFGIGGADLPYLTIIALLLSIAITVLGHYRGGDWVMASLLAEPLRADEPEGAWSALFATHPPLAQRIALLRGMTPG
jgi:Zn-dependent protease with chaperone function